MGMPVQYREFVLKPESRKGHKTRTRKQRKRYVEFIKRNFHLFTVKKEGYLEYLRSAKWAKVKIKVYKRFGKKCAKCSATKSLQVHHLHYRTLGIERYQDLQILCASCHKLEHERLRDLIKVKEVPKIAPKTTKKVVVRRSGEIIKTIT